MFPDFSHLPLNLESSLTLPRHHENGVGFVLALGIVTENPKVSLLFLLLPLPATEVMTLLLLRSQATLTLGQSADSQELYFKYMQNIKIVLTTLLGCWSIVTYAQ